MEQIRENVSLVDLISAKTKLVRRGRNHIGLCPFHHEKSPSFSVNDEKHFYHCFGCGAHGDAIHFITQTEHKSFSEAVEFLAQKAGITLERDTRFSQTNHDHNKRLYDLCELATGWFEAQLDHNSPEALQARNYIQERGLSPQAQKKFRLGYAPHARDSLLRFLQKQNFSFEEMIKAGLLIASEYKPGQYFDRFHGRLMFPIFDKSNRVIAFGGRTLTDAKPKYLNSPETELFSKKNVLYGYNFSKQSKQKELKHIVVEGYLDVIALHAAGFEGAVAPLGTSLHDTQILQLWKIDPEPIICFDGDAAGKKAAMRAAEISLPIIKPGFSVCFLELDQGYDPDSYLKQHSTQAFENLLATKSQALSDFLFTSIVKNSDLTTPERRTKVGFLLQDMAKKITDAAVANDYGQTFKARYQALIFPQNTKQPYNKNNIKSVAPRSNRAEKLALSERILLGMILSYPKLLNDVFEDFSKLEFQDAFHQKIQSEIMDAFFLQISLEKETFLHHIGVNNEKKWLDKILQPNVLTHISPLLKEGSYGAPFLKTWREVCMRFWQQSRLLLELKAVKDSLKGELSEKNWQLFCAVRNETFVLDEQQKVDVDHV